MEPLSGYLKLAEKLWHDPKGYAEGWNFGPKEDDAKPVGWIVEKLCSIWGEGSSWKLDEGMHPHEASYLKLDISKAKYQLGWTPHWDLDTALEKIVDWNFDVRRNKNAASVCLSQIQEFTKTCI